MKKLNLKNIIWKEGKEYVSWNINTGVSSFGATKREALTSLLEALELYFEDMPFSVATKVERPALSTMVFAHA